MPQNATTKIFAERLESLTELTRDKDHTKSDKQQAADIDISYQTFRKYLEDNAECKIDTLVKIAKHYNVTTDYLLGLTEASTTNSTERTICDYTGLSLKALETVVFLVSKKLKSNLLNTFLEDEDFVYLCTRMLMLRDYSLDFVNCSAPDELERIDEKCDVQRLKIIELVTKIMNSYDERTKQTDKNLQAQKMLFKYKYDNMNKEGDENG